MQAASPRDPSHAISSPARRAFQAFFSPKHVAVVGASDRVGSVGRTVLWNLLSNPFGGTVYPVNPKRSSVLGIRSYPDLESLPESVDLVVICTPAPTVPGLIRASAAMGVPAAVVISAGFKETGEEGRRLEQEVLEEARRGGMRIIGPNCLGVMRPISGLNATFAGSMARKGNVAFLSQSGALLTAILDWSLRENVGFSTCVSLGSMLDIGWGDLIHHLGEDPHTSSILIYMETIGDARAFLSAAREVALQKPIIVIKAGRTEAAAQAAASHTGSMTGSDEVLSAAFRRTGVLRVDSIADLFAMAEVFAKQPRPEGPNLTILTNAGGPGVLATDALIGQGGTLSHLSDETVQALDQFLPSAWSHGNPVDILGDADADRFAEALRVAQTDPGSDGLLVILTPQDMTDPTPTAEALTQVAREADKPVLASWMGGQTTAPGEGVLNQADIPTFQYPDTAARAFGYMWQSSYNLRALYETPSLAPDDDAAVDHARVTAIIEHARAERRTVLTEAESKSLLTAYGLPTTPIMVAATADEAVEAATALGYPVVVKLHSFSITHKTDVDGVQLNLATAEAVRQAFERVRQGVRRHHEHRTSGQAEPGHDGFDGVTVQPMVSMDGFELILGSSIDPQFGPVLLFGSGGTLVEVYKDRALALPPLNSTLARRMMEQTKIYHALHGYRGRQPVDQEALEQLLVRFSQLVVEQRWIKEIDLNPLVASGEGLLALDARVLLHAPEVDEASVPEPAIRPYPRHYVENWTLRDGREVVIRPIRPEDEPALVEFHHRLSERSVYLRYASLFQEEQRVAHERLSRLCFIDYDREMALVVEGPSAEDGTTELLGVGRLTKLIGTSDGEFAMLVRDADQGQGLGTELLERLIYIGRAEGLQRIVADILWQNKPMQGVCRKLGFSIHREELDDPMVRAVKELGDAA
ncbi:MAG: bifunctional acetate--CoA ligase family protein/GNAT family N-acetyltransferase [Bacteroidota bacterium]